MRHKTHFPWIDFLRPALHGFVVFLLASCGQPSSEALVDSAKLDLASANGPSAVIKLKQALQQAPQAPEARFLLGEALLQSGNAVASVVEFEKALQFGYSKDVVVPKLAAATAVSGQPKTVTDRFSAVTLDSKRAGAELKTVVAAAFIAQGTIDAAKKAVEEALQLDPGYSMARLLKARIVAGDGDRDTAAQLVDGLLLDEPALADAWQLKGELLWLGRGQIQEGTRAFEQAITVDPKFLPAHMALIAVRLSERDIKGFKARLDALRQVFPNHPETVYNEAQLALLEGNVTLARELVQRLMLLLPNSPRVLLLAGTIEMRSGSLVSAASHLAKAIQLNPEMDSARMILAQTYLKLGQQQAASASLQPLLSRPQPPPGALALAAEMQLQAGHVAEAATLFQRAVQADPENARNRAVLALTQIAAGQASAGLEQLESLANSDSSTYADLALISTRIRRSELDEALKAIDRLQEKTPNSALTHVLRGQVYLQRSDPGAARSAFERAMVVDSGYYPATKWLVSMDVREGKFNEAIDRLNAYAAKEPRNYVALETLTRLQLRSGVPSDVVRRSLSEAVNRQPGDVQARLLLVDFLLGSKDTSAALAAAQQGVSAFPGDLEMMDALGRAQVAAGETQQAIATFGRSLTAQPDSIRAHMRLAEAYLSSRDYERTRPLLRRVLELDPRHLPAQQLLMTVAMSEKRYADALVIAHSVQQQRPQELVGYLAEAEIHVSQQRPDLAVAALKTAFDRRPETETAIRYHGMLLRAGRVSDAERMAAGWRQRHPKDMAFVMYLGTAAMKRNEFAQAERLFRAALEALPNDAISLNNLAYALVRQGKPESLNFAQKANELRPDDPAVMDTLASSLMLANRVPEAVQLQRKAVALSKEAPVYRLHLAEMLLKTGDRDAAKAELETLRRLGGRFDRQAEVTALMARL